MNRKTILTTALVISLFFNVVLAVFGYSQQIAPDTAREQALESQIRAQEHSHAASVMQQHCEVLKIQAQQSLVACEARLTSLANN